MAAGVRDPCTMSVLYRDQLGAVLKKVVHSRDDRGSVFQWICSSETEFNLPQSGQLETPNLLGIAKP